MQGLNILIENLEEGVLFLSKDRQVIAINKAALNILGYEREKLINTQCPSVFLGTECARACEKRGHCSLVGGINHNAGPAKEVRDIELQHADGSNVSLRMWAINLPADESLARVAVVLKNRTLERKLEEEVSERLHLGGLIGHSQPMQTLYKHILRTAASVANVLIEGESGAGKELVARALHDNSDRTQGPYIRVHCAALAENLLESELFGHARGAFTGADSARAGRFEAADGGTLLLDEIGEISPAIQVKLLRVLQEREVERLGENKSRKVDVRIIAATNRNLGAMVKAGKFREDLYYRLRVLPIKVPPLRERIDDIALLSDHLLSNMIKRYKRDEVHISQNALQALKDYHWQGNVRELVNTLEYALVQTDSATIEAYHFPPEVQVGATTKATITTIPIKTIATESPRYYQRPAHEDEKTTIIRTLQETNGNKTATAKALHMSRTTLWKRLREYGLDK
jgi:transcriptional regulator with PAS, ATPase and Fis domain